MSDARLQAQCESRLGSTLRGKWVLEKLVGVGGMAAVYAGAHKIGRRDAIKILHPEVAKSTELRTRFEQEAAVANSFNHPGAVEIRDIDVTEDGCPFLVMEFLSGETLGEWAKRLVERGESLPVDDVLRFTEELLSALGAAHAQGIVHRDIKLDNVFITEAGAVKVLDFGIARIATGRAITVAGARLGTAAYMAPEQVRGEQVDGRADLFSVGATLFRLLAKRRIHEARSEADLFIKMGTEPAPKLATVAPDVSPDLATIVDRALQFRAEDRYPNAAAMAADLQRVRARGLGKRVDPGLSRTVPLSMGVLQAALGSPTQTPSPESTTARGEPPPPSLGSAPTNPILPRATVSQPGSDPTQALNLANLATMMQPTPQPPNDRRDAAVPSVRAPSATVVQPQMLRDVATAAAHATVSAPLAKAQSPAQSPVAGAQIAVAQTAISTHAPSLAAPPPSVMRPSPTMPAQTSTPGPVSLSTPQPKVSAPGSDVASAGRAEWVSAGQGVSVLREQPKSGPPWLAIGAVVIVLAIGAGAALALISNARSTDTSSDETEEADDDDSTSSKKPDKKKSASAAAAPASASAPAPTPTPIPTPTAVPQPTPPPAVPSSSSFVRPSFSSFNLPKLQR